MEGAARCCRRWNIRLWRIRRGGRLSKYERGEVFTNETRKENSHARRLLQGDRFPKIKLDLTDGSSITLPDEPPDATSPLLFYRGEW